MKQNEIIDADTIQQLQYEYLCGTTVDILAKKYKIPVKALVSIISATRWDEEKSKLKTLAFEQLQAKVLRSTAHAIDTLDSLSQNEDVNPRTRVEACNAILSVSPLKVTRIEASIQQQQAVVQKVYVSMQEQSLVDQHIDDVINGENVG